MSKENLSLDEIMKLAKAAESKSPEDLLGAVQKKLPEGKMNEIQKILNDKNALQSLLNSEQAQRLMKQFRNGK